MSIITMFWGFVLSNLWMPTIYQGRLLIKQKAYLNVFEYHQLPPALTVLVAITSALGLISIPVMLIALVFIREKFNYSDELFKKFAVIAFLSALAFLFLGFMFGKFAGLFTTIYTPQVETAITMTPGAM